MEIKKCVVMIGLLLLSAAACAEQHEMPDLKKQDIRISFLHTSDIHGRLLPYRMQVTLTDKELGLVQDNEPFGGVARIAHIINRERQRGGRIVYLDSGDVFQGAPIFNAFMGAAEFQAMSYLNPDAMVIGNHEFDSGLGNLIYQLRDWLSFPMLAANYYFTEGSELGEMIDPYTIVNVDGFRIGIIGIGDFSSLSSVTDIGNSLKILPLNMEETLNYYVGLIRPQVDMIVVASHAGLSHDTELIEATAGVDLVFGGHLHIVLDPPNVVKNRIGEDVVLVHSGAFAKYVGRLDVVLHWDEEAGRYKVKGHDYQLFPIDKTVKEDPEMAELMEDYRLKLNAMIDLTSVFGYSPKLLTKYGYEGGDSSLGNLVSEAIRRFARVEIGFTNTLGIRSNMYPGPITLDDMYNIFPFENSITLLYMSGVDLRRLFDYVSQRSSGRGCVSQLQVAGVNFVMNCNQDPPPYFYECYNCSHVDADGQEVATNWDGCLSNCLKTCKDAGCWEECLDGQVSFRTCIIEHGRKEVLFEDMLCLDSCTSMAIENPDNVGLTETFLCIEDCFPRAEEINITSCPDPMAIEDMSQCKNRSLIPDQVYEVATNDYIAQGGSGFTILKSNNTQFDTEIPLRDAVLEVIMTSNDCMNQCIDDTGVMNMATCSVYSDCLGKVGGFMDSFCEGIDRTGGEVFKGTPEGCAHDTGVCRADADCYPMENICASRECQTCTASADCKATNPLSNCVNGKCTAGDVKCLRGRCQKTCLEDQDCPGLTVPGQHKCVAGFCYPRQDIPCLGREECTDPYKTCFGDRDPCTMDKDCLDGFHCEARLCIPDRPPCNGDNDCDGGSKCVFGFCLEEVTQCQGDEQCGPMGRCVGNICSMPCGTCTTSADCPSGFDCARNLCIQASASCVDNLCRLVCNGDDDCLPGEGCTGGTCRPLICDQQLTGEALCRANNVWRAQQRCLDIPCVESQVDGRIGRLLPENLSELEFGYKLNDPEDLDLDY